MIFKNRLLKYILCSVLAVLFVSHSVQIYETGFSRDQFFIIIAFFMIIAIYKESRLFYYISLIVLSIGYIITMKELTNLGSVIFFLLALKYYSKPVHISVISVSIIGSYLIAYSLGASGNYINLVEGIIGTFSALSILYFIFIYQPSKIDLLAKVTPLDKRQLLIMKYLSKDIPRKQIPDKVPERELWKYEIENFTVDIINSEIAKIKKVLELKSEFSLGVWYSKKTEIPE